MACQDKETLDGLITAAFEQDLLDLIAIRNIVSPPAGLIATHKYRRALADYCSMLEGVKQRLEQFEDAANP